MVEIIYGETNYIFDSPVGRFVEKEIESIVRALDTSGIYGIDRSTILNLVVINFMETPFTSVEKLVKIYKMRSTEFDYEQAKKENDK